MYMKRTNFKIYFFILVIIIILIFIILFFKFETEENLTLETCTPINKNTNYSLDLTGDLENDTFEIITNQKGLDIKITSRDSVFLLSNCTNYNFLLDKKSPYNIQVANLSRNTIPSIIISGFKDNDSVAYVFNYVENEFTLLLETSSNMISIKDSNLNRTPQLITFDYYNELSPIKSYMLINNNLIDITKNSSNLPSMDVVVSFINLISFDYVYEIYPDIFSPTLNKQDLYILWNLDKDLYDYEFKNAFFYDSALDENGSISSLTAFLNFNKLNKETKALENLKLKIILIKDDYNTFKISNIINLEK